MSIVLDDVSTIPVSSVRQTVQDDKKLLGRLSELDIYLKQLLEIVDVKKLDTRQWTRLGEVNPLYAIKNESLSVQWLLDSKVSKVVGSSGVEEPKSTITLVQIQPNGRFMPSDYCDGRLAIGFWLTREPSSVHDMGGRSTQNVVTKDASVIKKRIEHFYTLALMVALLFAFNILHSLDPSFVIPEIDWQTPDYRETYYQTGKPGVYAQAEIARLWRDLSSPLTRTLQ